MDRLLYIGHATTLLRLGTSTVLTDPMLRRGLGPLRRHAMHPDPSIANAPDVVLISHVHRDHLDIHSLRRIPSSVPLVVPRGGARWAVKSGADEIREIDRDETIAVGAVEVTAVRAVHPTRRDRWGAGAEEAVGYVIAHGGRRVYFAGDTDLFDEMADIGPVDLALLPVAGWGTTVGAGHLDPKRAAVALEMIRPRIAVPIHWGTFYPAGLRLLKPGPLADPPHEFARLARDLAPEVEVRVLEPGRETSLEEA